MRTRAAAVYLVSVALVACSPDSAPCRPEPPNEVAESGAVTSEDAHRPPTSLRVVNETSYVVVLSSAEGRNTASFGPGTSLQLGSRRVCRWLPLTASTANGRLLDTYDKPCRGQTWTITDPATSP